jgi:hypothetical protein
VIRRTATSRWSFLLLALVQLLLPPAASWLDAGLERESSAGGGARAHVEAQGTQGCLPVHPSDCALCRASFVEFTRHASEPLLVAEQRTASPRPAAARADISSAPRIWDSQPRAPPVRA